MVKNIILIACLLFCIFTCGCSTVVIKYPDQKANRPILKPGKNIEIEIAQNADPSTFKVILNKGWSNHDITNSFKNVAAGAVASAVPPPLPMPDAGQKVNIWASARCKGNCSFTSEFVQITFEADSSLSVLPGDIKLRVGDTRQLRVELPETPYSNIEVLIGCTPSSTCYCNNVSFEGNSPGKETRVVIPETDRFKMFSITAREKGYSAWGVNGPGVMGAALSIYVE